MNGEPTRRSILLREKHSFLQKAYRTVLFTVNQTPRAWCSVLTHPRVFGNEGLLLFASARLQQSHISALYGSYLRMRPKGSVTRGFMRRR